MNRWIASYDPFDSEHIKHHGIKGQRWGEKNGPPYPLDEKEHKEVVSRSRPSGRTRDKDESGNGKGVNVNKKEASQHTPVKPASGRDKDFKKVYSKPGSFNGPSAGVGISTGTKEQYMLDQDDVNNVIDYDGSFEDLVSLLINVGFDESSILQLIQITKQKGGKLTVDESGYIPGSPYSIFKEFRNNSEKLFPELSVSNDSSSKNPSNFYNTYYKPKENTETTKEVRSVTTIDKDIDGKKNALNRKKKLISELSSNVRNKEDAKKLQKHKEDLETKKKELEELEKERNRSIDKQKKKDSQKIIKLEHSSIYTVYPFEENELYHYGRLGMKWYQHIFSKGPEYAQKTITKKRKALSENVLLAKNAARRGDAKTLAKLNKKTKRMANNVKQLEDLFNEKYGKKTKDITPDEEIMRQNREEHKKNVLRTGSAKDVFAIKDQLTQSEIQDAINRIQKEAYLEDLKTKETLNKINKAQNYVNTAISVGHTAMNAFNTYESIAKMANSITGEDTLPIFTGRKEKNERQAHTERAKKIDEMFKRGDPIEIYENIHLLTNDEVAQAAKRLTNKGTIEKKVLEAYERALAAEEEMKHSEVFVDFLCHHGIQNQKWGVRNGPPYPLNQKTHNRVVSSKTKSYSKDASEEDEKFKVGVTHLTAPSERFYRESINASDLSRIMNVAEGIKSGELSHIKRLERPNGKIREGDVADVNYARNHMGKNDPQWVKDEYSFLSKKDRLEFEKRGVELQYGNTISDPGLNNNCAKCSASLFLRSLGYDVQAGRSAHGALSTAGQYWFDNAVPYKEKSMENLEKRMASFGHQGKGMLGCRRADGSGHSIYFQNEKDEDGVWRTKIYDGQIGKKYDNIRDLFEAESFDDTQFSTITNLTNATPNWDHLAEDSVSRVNYTNSNLNVVQDIRNGQHWLADNFKYT